jgi:hypothetical protein
MANEHKRTRVCVRRAVKCLWLYESSCVRVMGGPGNSLSDKFQTDSPAWCTPNLQFQARLQTPGFAQPVLLRNSRRVLPGSNGGSVYPNLGSDPVHFHPTSTVWLLTELSPAMPVAVPSPGSIRKRLCVCSVQFRGHKTYLRLLGRHTETCQARMNNPFGWDWSIYSATDSIDGVTCLDSDVKNPVSDAESNEDKNCVPGNYA